MDKELEQLRRRVEKLEAWCFRLMESKDEIAMENMKLKIEIETLRTTQTTP